MPRIHTNICEQEIKMASGMENVPESFVISSRDPTCWDLLRAFAHIGHQETTLLGPTMLRVVANVCTGLYGPWFVVHDKFSSPVSTLYAWNACEYPLHVISCINLKYLIINWPRPSISYPRQKPTLWLSSAIFDIKIIHVTCCVFSTKFPSTLYFSKI